jgi:hypothetical protein
MNSVDCVDCTNYLFLFATQDFTINNATINEINKGLNGDY